MKRRLPRPFKAIAAATKCLIWQIIISISFTYANHLKQITCVNRKCKPIKEECIAHLNFRRFDPSMSWQVIWENMEFRFQRFCCRSTISTKVIEPEETNRFKIKHLIKFLVLSTVYTITIHNVTWDSDWATEIHNKVTIHI